MNFGVLKAGKSAIISLKKSKNMTHTHKLTTLGDGRDHACHEDDDTSNDMPGPAHVFDARTPGEAVPEGFNAVRITLDGTVKSDLKWEKEREAAAVYIKQGLRILWEMRLGLFNHLEKPIGNQSQLLSLCLSLEHFRDSLWKAFRNHTLGLCVYRGAADYKLGFPWDAEQQANLQDWLKDRFIDFSSFLDETGCYISAFNEITPGLLSSTEKGANVLSLFCRDVAGEYLDLLVDRLPDTLKCFALLDESCIVDPLLRAQLTTHERYPGLVLGIKSGAAGQDAFTWAPSGLLGSSPDPIQKFSAVNTGICLPSIKECRPSYWKGLADALARLENKSIPYRIIPEASLTTEWDGLDYLIVSSKNLSMQGRRKLQGFCAAGGVVVAIGNPIGLAQEVGLEDF